MPLTDAGVELIVDALNGAAYTPLNNANARLGVGNSNTAFNAAQTDLQAATNKLRKAMDPGFPDQPAADQLRLRATFDTSEANFDWEEWGAFNAAAAGTMLSRKVESLGTKPGSQSWQLTATLTIGNP